VQKLWAVPGLWQMSSVEELPSLQSVLLKHAMSTQAPLEQESWQVSIVLFVVV